MFSYVSEIVRKKMKNNCLLKKKKPASKFRSEVMDGLLSFSTTELWPSLFRYQQNSENQTVRTQRDLRVTKSCGYQKK